MQRPRMSGMARPKRLGFPNALKPLSELKLEGQKKSKVGKHSEDYFRDKPRSAWPMKMDIKRFGQLKYTDDRKRQYYLMDVAPGAYCYEWVQGLVEMHPKDAVFLWVAIGVNDNALQMPDATEPLVLVDAKDQNAKFTGTIIESSINIYKKQRKTGFVVLHPLKAKA